MIVGLTIIEENMQDMNIKYMQQALDIARRSYHLPGTLPFGAVIVENDRIVGEGLNRTYEIFDPTSHGEIEAIRDACQRLQKTDLSGCDLYSTCEPCSMCVSTMYLSGIENLYYASSLIESSEFFGRLANFDSKWMRRINSQDLRVEVGRPVEQRKMSSTQILKTEALLVFEEFLKQNPQTNMTN